MPTRRVHSYRHGSGRFIRLDGLISDQDMDDFLAGNFAAITARQPTTAMQTWEQGQRDRMIRTAYYLRMSRDGGMATLALAALERVMLALVLRRASLIRQHEEVLAKVTSESMKRTLMLRLVDLKQRYWAYFMDKDARVRIDQFLSELIHTVPEHDQTGQMVDRFIALQNQFNRRKARHPISQRTLPTRWVWE